MDKHIIYCRQPSQREKERLRNRKKAGTTEIKKCLYCRQDKQKIEFESYLIFPDKRCYICKECEDRQEKQENISMREVLATISSNLVKTKSELTMKEMAKYPYLIDSHKYLLLLKRLTK